MGQYRLRPIIVEAEQWWPGNRKRDEHLGIIWWWGAHYRLRTYPEGDLVWQDISPGDWIITHPRGDRFACKPGAFIVAYESVTSDGDGTILDASQVLSVLEIAQERQDVESARARIQMHIPKGWKDAPPGSPDA